MGNFTTKTEFWRPKSKTRNVFVDVQIGFMIGMPSSVKVGRQLDAGTVSMKIFVRLVPICPIELTPSEVSIPNDP